MAHFVVVDIETTGLSAHRHKITEIAAVRIDGENVIDEFQTLVDPEVPIPKFITRLTGIDNELVEGHPTVDVAMLQFIKYLGEDTFVAHNASFDYKFLHHNASMIGHKMKNEKLCTRMLANRLMPDLYSKKLGALCDVFQIDNNQAHRAMSDTKATVEVFQKFLKMLGGMGHETHEEILKFQATPRSRI